MQKQTSVLAQLGFKRAARLRERLNEAGPRMQTVYRAYQHIRREDLRGFGRKHNQLGDIELVPIADCLDVPPDDTLDRLEMARVANLFDIYIIIKSAGGSERVLAGTIDCCGDYFVLGSWEAEC